MRRHRRAQAGDAILRKGRHDLALVAVEGIRERRAGPAQVDDGHAAEYGSASTGPRNASACGGTSARRRRAHAAAPARPSRRRPAGPCSGQSIGWPSASSSAGGAGGSIMRPALRQRRRRAAPRPAARRRLPAAPEPYRYPGRHARAPGAARRRPRPAPGGRLTRTPVFQRQRLDFEAPLRAVRLGVQPSHQRAAAQDRQGEVAVAAFFAGRIAFEPVVEAEQFQRAAPVPDDGVERRQNRRQGGRQLAGGRVAQPAPHARHARTRHRSQPSTVQRSSAPSSTSACRSCARLARAVWCGSSR